MGQSGLPSASSRLLLCADLLPFLGKQLWKSAGEKRRTPARVRERRRGYPPMYSVAEPVLLAREPTGDSQGRLTYKQVNVVVGAGDVVDRLGGGHVFSACWVCNSSSLPQQPPSRGLGLGAVVANWRSREKDGDPMCGRLFVLFRFFSSHLFSFFRPLSFPSFFLCYPSLLGTSSIMTTRGISAPVNLGETKLSWVGR